MAKNPFPFQKPGAADAAKSKRRMGKGGLPGFDKLPKPKGDNPNDTPAMERAERMKGIKT